MSHAASISSLPEFVSGMSHLQLCSYFGVLKGSWLPVSGENPFFAYFEHIWDTWF